MPNECQHDSGESGLQAITNALSALFPRQVTPEIEEEILDVLLDAFPGDVPDLVKNGCDRIDVDGMLHSIHRWTVENQWPAWVWNSLHPVTGEPTEEFWEAVAVELTCPRTAAVIGFGADTEPKSRYKPHWTCVTRVTANFVFCKGSSLYPRVPRVDTGVRPAKRWAIEHCFILNRQ
jgi:hypothetical protein